MDRADLREELSKLSAKVRYSDAYLATHPSPKSSPKEIVGHHGHRPHGTSILWPALYEHLRAKGMTKAKAAQISNGLWRKKHGMPPKSVPGTKGKVGAEMIPDVRKNAAVMGAVVRTVTSTPGRVRIKGDGDGDGIPYEKDRLRRMMRMRLGSRKAKPAAPVKPVTPGKKEASSLAHGDWYQTETGGFKRVISTKKTRSGINVTYHEYDEGGHRRGYTDYDGSRQYARTESLNPTQSVAIGNGPTAKRDAHISKYGLNWEDGNDQLSIVTRARAWKGWDSLPTTSVKISDLHATEEYIGSKYVDRVLAGEPLRQGYDPYVLIDRDGKAYIIDGHHRAAMYSGLGHDEMPAKVIDLRSQEQPWTVRKGEDTNMSDDNYGRHGYTEFEKAELAIRKRHALRTELAKEEPTTGDVHVPGLIPDFAAPKKTKKKQANPADADTVDKAIFGMPTGGMKEPRDGDGDGMVASKPGGPEDTRVQPKSSGQQMNRRMAPRTAPQQKNRRMAAKPAPQQKKRGQRRVGSMTSVQRQNTGGGFVTPIDDDAAMTVEPRSNSPRVEEDQVPFKSPTGAKLVNYRGTGSGAAIYADGSVFDGKGWQRIGRSRKDGRNAKGQSMRQRPARSRNTVSKASRDGDGDGMTGDGTPMERPAAPKMPKGMKPKYKPLKPMTHSKPAALGRGVKGEPAPLGTAPLNRDHSGTVPMTLGSRAAKATADSGGIRIPAKGVTGADKRRHLQAKKVVASMTPQQKKQVAALQQKQQEQYFSLIGSYNFNHAEAMNHIQRKSAGLRPAGHKTPNKTKVQATADKYPDIPGLKKTISKSGVVQYSRGAENVRVTADRVVIHRTDGQTDFRPGYGGWIGHNGTRRGIQRAVQDAFRLGTPEQAE